MLQYKITKYKNGFWFRLLSTRRNIVMSIQPVSKTDTNSNIGSRLASATAVGAAAGGLYTAKDSHWLYKGAPSDSFVKNIKKI